MKKITILLGGHVKVTSRLLNQIKGSRVIAADSGIGHAKALGLQPFLWLGDFDSSNQEDFPCYVDIPRQIFPVEKDMTDGEIAVHAALEEGAEEIILCGAFGGSRSDHSLLHMTMATTLAQKGIKVLLTSGTEDGIPLVRGGYDFDFPDKSLFSIIAFSDIAGLTIKGAHWQLQDATLGFGSSLTLSNQVDGSLFVSLASGRGILMANFEE